MIWSNLIIVVQVISALSIIGLVLMQHGKGADMGAAFGSGASGSLFGASGSSNFMSKATAVAAAVFFGTTLTLAYIGNDRSSGDNAGVMGRAQAPAAGIPTTTPVQTAPADVPTLPAGSAVPAAPVAPTPAPATPAAASPAPAAPTPATTN
jgi:preprotein translocase subunit SecG